jgi:hypothetical protein
MIERLWPSSSVRCGKVTVVRRTTLRLYIETAGTADERCTGMSAPPKAETAMPLSKWAHATTPVWARLGIRLTLSTVSAKLFRVGR